MEKINLNIKFEEAVRFLGKYMPKSDEGSRKPVFFHDIRVGVYLYEKNYSAEIVVAGVLHDALEWASVNEDMLRSEFGESIVRLVLANTKNDSITDKEEKTYELIERCVKAGQDALIIKAADLIDSYKWYFEQQDRNGMEYCLRNSRAVFKFKPHDYDNQIFSELKIWQNKIENKLGVDV